MRILSPALVLLISPLIAAAATLKVVNVSAPAINCVFNSTCTFTVNDTSDNFVMSTGGTGFLQSRTFKGAAGAPAAGLFGYEYRVDLRSAVGATAISCIDWMTISFGPVVSTLNYGGDAKPEEVFVITKGGLGSIGIASAVQTGSNLKLKFTTPICGGSAPGNGDSSFFWGLTSRTQAKFVTAAMHETGGATHVVKARAPM
jgi:hypothetical protein